MRRLPLMMMTILFAATLLADNAEAFQQANNAYDEGRYREALGRYLELEERGVVDADLYYNIANTYYRRHQIGRAVLYYKRALAANPAHEHANRNLSLIAGELGEESAAPPAAQDVDFLSARLRDLYEAPSLHLLAILLTVLLALAIGTGHYLLHMPPGRDRTMPMFLLWLLVVAWIALGLLTWRRAADWSERVYAEELRTFATLARKAPDPDAPVVMELHAGQQAAIIATAGEWSRIIIPDGRKGWTPSRDWTGDPEAVVMVERTDVYSAPGKQSEILANLPEGYVVRVAQQRDDWCRIQLPDGQEGWMESADLEMVL